MTALEMMAEEEKIKTAAQSPHQNLKNLKNL
jgi:hypothetical protein